MLDINRLLRIKSFHLMLSKLFENNSLSVGFYGTGIYILKTFLSLPFFGFLISSFNR